MHFTGRITHLASGDLWGGAEAFVYALASEQQRAHPGSVSCIIMNPGRLARALIDEGVYTLVLDETHTGFADLLRAVRSHVSSFRPHVLHAHRQKENLLALLGSWKRAVDNRPIVRVTTVHGMPEPIHARNIIRSGVKNLLNAIALHAGFDAVVAVSQDIATKLAPHFRDRMVTCIHNGIAVPLASSHPLTRDPSDAQRLHLLALGRLVPIKRFDRLKLLSDELARVAPPRPTITLAGDGPLRAALQELFGGSAAEDFRMPGFVRETSALLNEADALVITSDHEGIPMAVLEALSMGVPVFGFAVGGLPEIVSPGVPLQLVPPGDSRTLAETIAAYFSQHEPGTRTPPPPTWSFDIRRCAGAYNDLYGKLSHST